MSEQLDRLRSELRRGAIVLAVLAQLRHEHYGYSLRQSLAAHGVQVEEGTLYPLIRRLEKQGLLTSEWREDGKRRKRFYRLSTQGEQVLEALMMDWQSLNSSIVALSEQAGRRAKATGGRADAAG